DERAESPLVDGIPKAQFGGDAVIEPVQDGQAVAALRCGGKAQQFARPQVYQQVLVAGCRGMVELVHDDHVEVVWRKMLEVGGMQALDRGKHMLVVLWPTAVDP